MTTSITHRFFYPHPPEVVWEYLTKAELIELWLMKNNFQLINGYDFQFNIAPIPAFDFDGIVYCKVLEIDPLKKLTYSWKCGPGNGKITLDSIVEWTLHATENGTELLLENTGFKEANFMLYAAMNKGWLENMQKINALIINTKK